MLSGLAFQVLLQTHEIFVHPDINYYVKSLQEKCSQYYSILQELAWRNQDPEERKIKVLPEKHSSLRLVPGYSKFINEQFERCLDLYLCPRQRRMRVRQRFISYLNYYYAMC